MPRLLSSFIDAPTSMISTPSMPKPPSGPHDMLPGSGNRSNNPLDSLPGGGGERRSTSRGKKKSMPDKSELMAGLKLGLGAASRLKQLMTPTPLPPRVPPDWGYARAAEADRELWKEMRPPDLSFLAIAEPMREDLVSADLPPPLLLRGVRHGVLSAQPANIEDSHQLSVTEFPRRHALPSSFALPPMPKTFPKPSKKNLKMMKKLAAKALAGKGPPPIFIESPMANGEALKWPILGRPHGSKGPCNVFGLANAYDLFKETLQRAQQLAFDAPEHRCPSCKQRWLELQRADELTVFLNRAGVEQENGGVVLVEDHKPQQPKTFSTDTGGKCRFGAKCAAWRGPTVCSQGKCLCKPNHIAVKGPRGAVCVSAPDEVDGEISGDLGKERSEISKVGQAMEATLRAGVGARLDFKGELEPGMEEVPDDVSGAIYSTQVAMREVAAHAFRCRANSFLSI